MKAFAISLVLLLVLIGAVGYLYRQGRSQRPATTSGSVSAAGDVRARPRIDAAAVIEIVFLPVTGLRAMFWELPGIPDGVKQYALMPMSIALLFGMFMARSWARWLYGYLLIGGMLMTFVPGGR